MHKIITIAPAKKISTNTALREFHLARDLRDQLDLDEILFALNGNVVLINNEAAHQIVQKLNELTSGNLQASDLNAMGLIDEILHFVVDRYIEQVKPEVITAALEHLDDEFGATKIDSALEKFITAFPPVAVYKDNLTAQEYLLDTSEGLPNRALALEEMVLHWLANLNPAFAPFRLLFDDENLEDSTGYRQLMDDILTFFSTQPPYGPKLQNLIEMLREPAKQSPNSLAGQLKYMSDNWGDLLGTYLMRLLRSLDFMAEEQKHRGLGPGEAPILQFGLGDEEYERFSPDSEWMPRVVMIAKNTLVWLDQLEQQYQRPVERLDQIPDEELDRLANYGFTTLWLIGLWERSTVSKKIKQWCGNPDAEASAYALKRYVIAESLGGPDALENLKARCWQRGIRLASDMVPNHTGLDADWLIEHPDWYVQIDQPPFPAYKFESGNLSEDERISLRIEDHYFERSDAAVVFQHVDNSSGQVRYIYHGNDGTTMPWNDTAQLNYLLPQVREAVIQTIIYVARQTPIIRFDAAMTLAKRHFQRLWFPEPGSGGDIPSRAEHGLSKAEFNRFFPQEFWREVVDRVATEVPHTLLLAEAFWMMEGYFVRTLGMHRVYNSAFMNMLKMEENAKYRQTIKNTIEFDPEILKRFVNFLNNPDEETAVVQFGSGDKYFGVTMLMLTMPGLPMFGHGQIEGYHEKYGMEFRHAYWDEHPDEDIVSRHERDIFPVMRKRYLFAEVEKFRLFDLYETDGTVNENVFAYTNRLGNEQALVIYNNAYQQASGWLRTSAAFNDKSVDDTSNLQQTDLAQALAIPNATDCFLIFREHISGLEFIRRASDIHLQGLPVSLRGYQYQVFWEMREVWDDQYGRYGQLHDALNGQGVSSTEESIKDLFLKPVRNSFSAAFNKPQSAAIKKLAAEIVKLSDSQLAVEKLAAEIVQSDTLIDQFLNPVIGAKKADFDCLKIKLSDETNIATLRIWAFLRSIGKAVNPVEYPRFSRRLISELGLERPMTNILSAAGLAVEQIEGRILLIKIMCRYQHHITEAKIDDSRQLFRSLLDDGQIHNFLGINSFDGIIWFNQESFDELIQWLTVIAFVDLTGVNRPVDELLNLLQHWQGATIRSEFQLEKLLEELE